MANAVAMIGFEMDKKKIEAFLNELTELTLKYGIGVGGCGCCNSPWLSPESNSGNYTACIGEDFAEDLEWKAS